MNIQFTLKANTYRKAADIEDFLKDKGISYSTTTDDKPSLGAPRHNKFPRIDKQKLDDINGYLIQHPDISYVVIGEKFNVHQQTVSKISKGVHPMQKSKLNGEDKVEPKTEPLRTAAITKSELAAVISTIASNQYASNVGISNMCGVSAATVGRIRSGTHPLQIDGSAG